MNTGHQIITAVVPVYVCAVVVINHVNGVFRTLFSNPLKRIISGKEESVKEGGRERQMEGGKEKRRGGGGGKGGEERKGGYVTPCERRSEGV